MVPTWYSGPTTKKEAGTGPANISPGRQPRWWPPLKDTVLLDKVGRPGERATQGTSEAENPSTVGHNQSPGEDQEKPGPRRNLGGR